MSQLLTQRKPPPKNIAVDASTFSHSTGGEWMFAGFKIRPIDLDNDCRINYVLMQFREHMNRSVLLPLADKVGRTSILEKRRFLLKSQWWSEERIRAFQLIKLKRLIRHAYLNVPFYRRAFKSCCVTPSDIKTLADVQKLPILTKRDVRQNQAQLIARNYPLKFLLRSRTGGSTGEPLQFYKDLETKSWAGGAMHRYYSWIGMKLGEPMIAMTGGSLGGFLSSRSLRNRMLDVGIGLLGNHPIPVFPISENAPLEISNVAKRRGLRAIRGYPSVLHIIAGYAKKQMVEIEGIQICSTTAERLYPHQRDEIEKAFSADVFDQYGCGEINSIAAQCECKESYHAFDEHVLVECPQLDLGDKGSRNAVITDLDNYGMPFIRYENGDVLSFESESCSCGRALTTIDKVLGRTHDFLVSSGGLPIAGEFIPHLFQKASGFDRYFVHQKSIHEIVVRIVRNERYCKSEVEELVAKMKEVLGTDVSIDFENVNRIKDPPSMKLYFIKSDVKFP